MTTARDLCAIELEPRLAEEAVLLATELLTREERARFRGERDAIYEVPDPERRERLFGRLHARWFDDLKLLEPLRRALAERPGVARSAARCLVMRAPSARQEGADLRGRRGALGSRETGPPTLMIQIRPEALLDPDGLLDLLRHELLHVADMLDPSFAYEPSPPLSNEGPSPEMLRRERYRVLWDTTVDGRLDACGLLPPGVEEARKREFLATFPMLGGGALAAFERFFRGPRPDHPGLLSFAADPAGAPAAVGITSRKNPERCPICRFPTTAFHPAPRRLGEAVLALIRKDFPAWSAEQGLCLQCADLHEARVERSLPSTSPRIRS